jgi:radical SAM protein with 4Fe4S-binding SPASM domain
MGKNALITKGKAIAARGGLLVSDQEARKVFKNNFLKEFSYTNRLVRSLGHPKIFQLETTNHCPYRCGMCPRTHAMTRELGHMDIGLFRSILDQIDPIWQVDVVGEEPYIGLWHFGEPMVYKHFVEAIHYCHSRGLRVILSTNPSVWTRQRIEEILEAGVDEMYVMFDGMDDETSMAVRGPVASFQRGEANFMTLLERKAQLGTNRPVLNVSMVKQPKNKHQWRTFQDHWKSVSGVNDVILGDLSTFGGDVEQLVTISNTLIAQDPEQVRVVARYERMSKLPCYYPWHSMTVTWDGKAVPCCRDHNAALVFGDLNKESLESIWNGPPIQELRRQFIQNRVTAAPCSTCRERSAEIGLPGYYYPVSLIDAKRVLARLAGSKYP